jgi:glycerate-2-kinase
VLIKNRSDLESFHGAGARIVLSALETAIKSVEPGALVRAAVSYDGHTVTVRDICGQEKNFSDFDEVYIVGAGKGTGAMADALCAVFGSRVVGGAINVPKRTAVKCSAVDVTHASHPIPDKTGVRGAEKIVDTVKRAQESDLVFVLISGGGSALMPLPAEGVLLADKQQVTSQLLASCASIHKINAVRKHLSAIKGGRLVQHARCTVISLVLSDVVGDDLGVIASGPTFPDSSTFNDALRIMKKYRISAPAAAVDHIVRGAKGLINETPKHDDSAFGRVHNFLIGNNAAACKSAVQSLRGSGLKTEYIGSEYDGEARDLGRLLAKLAADLPAEPFALVAGGETTVRLVKKAGKGGRNQEAALSYAMHAKDSDAFAAFMGTDGIDGNSDAAGALVSPKSIALAQRAGARHFLAIHDSYRALEKMHSLIFTGLTGTNVNDISILCRFTG